MSTRINITIDNHTVLDTLISCKIDRREGDFCLSVTLEMNSDKFWRQCDPIDKWGSLRVKVIVGDTIYQFLIEERDSEVRKDGMVYRVWGRSKQALLDKPYSKTILDTDDTEHPWQTGNVRAATIVSYALNNYCPYSVSVTWNVDNFMVYQNTLSVSNRSPKDIIATLAEAIGAELVANDDGSLAVRSYSVSEGSSVASYSDLDDIVQLNESIEHSSGFNAVTVHGHETQQETPDGSVVSPYIRAENIRPVSVSDDEETPNDIFIGHGYYVDVYYYSSAKLTPLCYFPAGSNNRFGSSSVIAITETVELLWGKGNTSKPNLVGETEISGDENIPYATREVTYSTKYQTWFLRPGQTGDHKALFYFVDQSTYHQYSLTVTRYVAELPDDPDPDNPEVPSLFIPGAALEWESEEFILGETVEIRVYKGQNIVSDRGNTAGTLMSITSQNNTIERVEVITFSDGIGQLEYPYFSSLSVQWLGNYSSSHNPSVLRGSNVIIKNDLINNDNYQFVQARVTYKAKYSVYRFTLPAAFTGTEVTAWFVFDNEAVGQVSLAASITVGTDDGEDVTDDPDDDDTLPGEDTPPNITPSIFTPHVVLAWEGSGFTAGNRVEVRVYNPGNYTIESQGNTTGASMSIRRTDSRYIEETIAFKNGEAKLSFPYDGYLTIAWLGSYTSWSPSEVQRGSNIVRKERLVNNSNYSVVMARVTYRTQFDVFRFKAPSSYDGSLTVWFIFKDDRIGQKQLSGEIGDAEEEAPTGFKDITVISESYITEVAIPGSSIWIDEVNRGVTDENGRLLVEDLAVGDHTFRMTADGFTPTDEDDLTNDSFTVS